MEAGRSMIPLIRHMRLIFFSSSVASDPVWNATNAEPTNADQREAEPTSGDACAELRLEHIMEQERFPWDDFAGFPYLDQYSERFAIGHEALIGRVDGALAFHAWIARKTLWVAELDLDWNLPPGDACIYDVVTLPAFRGRGYYPSVLRRLAAQPGCSGNHGVWVFCEDANRASEHGIRKAGYVQRGALAACWLRRRVLFRSGRLAGVNA
jgi:hypothetical protein